MEDVARHYGYEPNRAGFICCPFRGEETPSLKVYPGNGGFHCFGCHAGGSVIDFTSKLFGLDPLGAVRRLNEDFLLGLPIDRKPTAEDRRAARHRVELAATRQAFEEWRRKMVNQLNAAIRVANQARPATWDEMTGQQALAMRWRDTLENYADVLAGGSTAEQMEIFRLRKEVTDVCNRILNDMPKKFEAA